MDFKKIFERFESPQGFIKTTASSTMDGSTKAALNRKGNVLFNAGDAEGARRIFLTTGYSDGLSRVGDYYKSKGNILEALKMYWIAPDRTKAEPIIQQLSEIIRHFIKEEVVDE
jgi:Ethanolamine utilization protein EutJ (predicted chaperonin)